MAFLLRVIGLKSLLMKAEKAASYTDMPFK